MTSRDDDFDDLPAPSRPDPRPEHRRLAATIILDVVRGKGPQPDYRRAALWLKSVDGRFWATVAGLDVDAAVARVRRLAASSQVEPGEAQ